MSDIAVEIIIGVVMGVIVGVTVGLLLPYLDRVRRGSRTSQDSLPDIEVAFESPSRSSSNRLSEEGAGDTYTAADISEVARITRADQENRPKQHELEKSISLEDRVALVRFVVTICGIGPYGASANRLEDAYPPRMNYLRQQTGKMLRKITGLRNPAELPNLDAERVFEELAHNRDFLELCKMCAVLLRTLLDDHYRPLANACLHEPDVIHPEILPSGEAIKLLVG